MQHYIFSIPQVGYLNNQSTNQSFAVFGRFLVAVYARLGLQLMILKLLINKYSESIYVGYAIHYLQKMVKIF